MEDNTNMPVTATDNAEIKGTATTEQISEQTQPKQGKTYSTDDFNKMASSQFAAGQAAIMKELGFSKEQLKDVAAQTTAFKQWQDAQKTESQRLQDQLKEIAEALNVERGKVQTYEKRMSAISSGVPVEKIEWYIRLADARDGEESFDEKMKKTIEEYPIPKKDVPKFSTGTTKTESETKKRYTPPEVI